jgi:hypothetical protein
LPHGVLVHMELFGLSALTVSPHRLLEEGQQQMVTMLFCSRCCMRKLQPCNRSPSSPLCSSIFVLLSLFPAIKASMMRLSGLLSSLTICFTYIFTMGLQVKVSVISPICFWLLILSGLDAGGTHRCTALHCTSPHGNMGPMFFVTLSLCLLYKHIIIIS